MKASLKIAQWVLASLVLMLTARAQEQKNQLSWPDTRGNVESLDEYKGKLVVLNFWATWCVPCRHEMPMLAEMERKYCEKGLVVLGASVDDAKTRPQVRPYGEEHRIPFPLLLGVTPEQMRSLGLGEEIPATAFFDGDGKLVARVLGELDKPELEHRIEWMLGKHHGKEPAPFVNGFEKKARPKSQPSIFTH
jgi:thiol-disulfide isomerase/thioredoxin